MSIFTGRITMPVRGTCLIQKVSAKLSLGFQSFGVIPATQNLLYVNMHPTWVVW